MTIPFSGTVAIRAMRDGDFVATPFPGTDLGLQDAIDFLAGGKGEIAIGPGTILTATAIWIHSGCHLRGAGISKTFIKRSAMADSDPDNSGAVINAGPFGSNGTMFTSAATGSNIEIESLTVDGNQATFSGTVTRAGLVPSGIRTDFVDGVVVRNCRAQNCLGDGFRHRYCRNVSIEDVEADTVGQWATVSARNGINFIGDAGLAGEWGYNYSLRGASINTVRDEAIQCSGINRVTVSDVSVDGCAFVFECTSDASRVAGQTFRNWSISNIVARNVTNYMVTFNQNTTDSVENCVFSNCVFYGDAANHDGGAISLPNTAGNYIRRLSFENCVFANINSKDTSTHNWFDCQPGDATGYSDIKIIGCSFSGKSGSVRSGNEVGVLVRGAVQNFFMDDVLLKDVPGTAIRINDSTSVAGITLRSLRLSAVTVDGANDYAFRITAASATSSGTLSEILLRDCTAKDTNKVINGAAFDVNISQAGATIQNVYLRGCKAYQTGGSGITFGFSVSQSAGTASGFWIEECDFSGAATGWVTSSGASSNWHYRPPVGASAPKTSGATFTIPNDGTVVHVTGANNITNGFPVNKWDNGRQMTLVFDGILTVSDTGTSVLAGNFTTTADDSLTVICDGTNWYEVARSIN